MAKNDNTPVTLPTGIEVFCAGELVTDAGDPITFTCADVADIAAGYNPALHESPITVGHPKDNAPAYGWIQGVECAGNKLLLQTAQVEPQFAELVRAGRFKKRSASFYPPEHPQNPRPGHWYLRHVGFLGALPPAVKGPKDIPAFSESGGKDGFVCFTESIQLKKDTSMAEPVITPPSSVAAAPEPDANQAQVAQLQQRVTELQQQVTQLTQERDAALAAKAAAEEKLAAQARAEEAQQQQQITQFAEGLVKAGKITPADKPMQIQIMASLAADDKKALVQFSEGNTTRTESRLKAYQHQFAGKEAVVSFGEFAAEDGAGAQARPLTDEELDKKVREYMAAHPEADYAQALSAVTQGL